uniref:NADH-ubiquinone oxidoreductase chain 2 n=1 Tax=Roxasellana stellata TaxID=2754847 RepID=A0A7G3XWD0_9HEMI|nr:NADH dehydrogenase subunit 2 [Roxasellana stellata]QLJ57884.1 NADH dehydrogenase subunit 2 [Roxasellana stellata]
MFLNSTKLILSNTMMIGVIMTICSNNWFSMWMGLEISLLSFIPMMQTNKILSSESMIKYFIIQSVASTLMLLSTIIMLIGVSMMNEMMLTISMLIKIGSAPFHNWVIFIIETMNYYEMWIMLTIIKMPPLTILFNNNHSNLMIPIVLGMIISSVSCLNQTSLKKTIGFSSIYNISLMLLTINKFNIMIVFMLIYAFMLGLLLSIINKMMIGFINQMILNEKTMFLKMNLWINMLSMGGFPPLMGFFNKLMILQTMINLNQIVVATIVVLTSMLVMLFYMRLTFTLMFTTSTTTKWMFNMKLSYFNLTMNFILFPSLIFLTSMN